MLTKKIRYGFVIILVLAIRSLAWTGDIASFVDFGFSSDGQNYMFGQYGVQSQTLRPWADLFVVDVPHNTFVSGGRVSFVHDSPVIAGQDGVGALFRLVSHNTELVNRYGITYLLQGQLLYLSLDTTQPSSTGETIEFRDFERDVSYRARLVSTIEGSGANLSSSFFITLERTPQTGAKKTYTVGNPQVKRTLVSAYRMKKVMVAPRGGAIVFVIETSKPGIDGPDVRYMVETVSIQ
jgi:predicted secreted protein